MGQAGSIRPDVYTMRKSFSNPRPLAYEVKVTKADFARDVAEDKWAGYLQCARSVTFAVPAGLIKKTEVPPNCGLMVRNDEKWITLKAPRMQADVEIDYTLCMKLLISGVERLQETIGPREASVWDVARKHRERLGKEVAQALIDVEGYVYSKQNELDKLVRIAKQETDSAVELRKKLEKDRRELAQQIAGRLYEILGVQERIAYLPTMLDNLEMKINQKLRALEADVEVQRLQRVVDDMQQLLRDAGREPKDVPYWVRRRL